MENLLCTDFILCRNWGKVISVAQIAVALSKGIAHLGNHYPKVVLLIKAQPKTHRIKNMAERPRLRQ